MIILYIIFGIIAFFSFFCMIPIKVIIKTKPELSIKVKVLHITVFKIPKKEKPVKLSQFRIKKFRKRRLKEQENYLYKKLRSDSDKKRKDSVQERVQEIKKEKTLSEKVEETLDLIKLVVLRALKKFGKYLKISVYRLRISVGGDEPDKTAITYGYVCQALSYLSHIFDKHLNMKYPGRVENRIYAGCDFSSQKTDIDVFLTLEIKAWHIFGTGLSALIGYLTMPKKNK